MLNKHLNKITIPGQSV